MPTDQKSRRRSARAEAKRELIVSCAMRHFAEHGYQGARIEDMAAELQIAKGSVFQHYGSKAGLFLECYKRAVSMLPASLDDWTSFAIQDALVTEELDPGLFHRWRSQPERQRMRLDHFAVLLESAIGSDHDARAAVAAVDVG